MKRAITLLMDNARYAEKEKRHLQLDNLYYQINPHFLLNALNSLHWLAMMSNQQDIVQYVHQLNSILSYSLGKTTGIITLRTELRVADDYVKLQQMRYDFNFSMDVEEGAYLDTPCARLILQPVLENAICHNMNEFGSLLLEVHPHDDGHVCIRIRDDGAGMKALPSEGLLLRDVSDSGIGFKYLQGRWTPITDRRQTCSSAPAAKAASAWKCCCRCCEHHCAARKETWHVFGFDRRR